MKNNLSVSVSTKHKQYSPNTWNLLKTLIKPRAITKAYSNMISNYASH